MGTKTGRLKPYTRRMGILRRIWDYWSLYFTSCRECSVPLPAKWGSRYCSEDCADMAQAFWS